ncbi:MAG: Segregation and condensation protein [Labilithrix sp.]|nr:Segregation and condensation protein [Labilithrix sp.]
MSKRKKNAPPAAPPQGQQEGQELATAAATPEPAGHDLETPAAAAPREREKGATNGAHAGHAEHLDEHEITGETAEERFDAELTVNLGAGDLRMPGRDDLDEPTVTAGGEATADVDSAVQQRKHLRGLIEALVFAADVPIKLAELAKLAHAPQKDVRAMLDELQHDYQTRGIHLDEVAGGYCFRTSPRYAPFVRDLTKQKPVRLTRAQVETLAIIAYRQPITRPEIDDVRGVDTGPVLKLLLERDLVRILGKRDEVGRPLIYGTTGAFLEFFGLKSLKDLPTLREFTELSDESRDAFEDELGEAPDVGRGAAEGEDHGEELGVAEEGGERAGGDGDPGLEALAELERLQEEADADAEDADGDADADAGNAESAGDDEEEDDEDD